MTSAENTEGLLMGNLSEYLRIQARDSPDKPAIMHPETITFRKMDQLVDQICHGLSQQGFKKGTRTVMLVKTNPDFFLLTFALLRVGCVPVFIDPGVGRKVMRNSLAGVEAEAFIGSPMAHVFRLLYRRKFQHLRHVVSVGHSWIRGGTDYLSLFKTGLGSFEPAPVRLDETGGIFFTSGSTGPPKGVIYQNRMFHAQIDYFRTHYHWNPGDIDLCTFPLIGLFSLCLGVSVVIADMNPSKPAALNPEKIWANLEDFQCTHMFGSPMVLRKLADYGIKNGKRLDHLNRIVTAGAPAPPELLVQMKSLIRENAKIHTPYGATEALPVTDARFSELMGLEQFDVFRSDICVGKPLPGMNIRIIGITEKAIPFMNEAKLVQGDQVGEIVVQGPVVTQGYLNNPEADEKSKIVDHSGNIWHRMGDLGRLDDEGRLWFYGRKNHRVVTEGSTLFTIPCEAVFNKHPRIIRSALVGIKGSISGSAIPVICLQVNRTDYWLRRRRIRKEMGTLASSDILVSEVKTFLFRTSFPVDPRHNAKIFREKLSKWAQRKIK